MREFTLDTSGAVDGAGKAGSAGLVAVSWSDLDPFTQGYVEALFASSEHPKETYHGRGFRRPVLAGDHPGSSIIAWMPLGFSDLAPEALSATLKDCGDDQATGLRIGGREDRTSAKAGRAFWKERQSGSLFDCPPLTPYLGDDTKIYLKEAGA